MDTHNRKLKKKHNDYCNYIKRKRTRRLTQTRTQEENLIHVQEIGGDEYDGDHSNMLTALPFGGVDGGHSTQVAFRMTNDFISKNKYTPEFYNTHEQQKREAFSRIRDEQVARAKYNRQVYEEARRQKVINYMGRWDVHRVRREAVI